MAKVGEGCKDITNKLENIPVSILLIPHCGCFTSTGKCAAKNCCAQILTVGFHQLVDGWNFMPIFDKNITGKISILWQEKIFLQVTFCWTGHLTQSQYQNDSQCQASMPVPGQETWVRACVHLVSQKTVINDSVSKL